MQINLRPLASPLPLGLLSFGLGMLLLAGEGCGRIPIKRRGPAVTGMNGDRHPQLPRAEGEAGVRQQL